MGDWRRLDELGDDDTFRETFEPKVAGREVATLDQPAAPAVLVRPLQVLDIAKWDSVAVPQRLWAVVGENNVGIIPLLNVTLLSGEGAIGKSNLMLHLCCSTALASDWIGFMPMAGPAFYLGAEDDTDELHRRLARIAEVKHVRFADLAPRLHVISRAGADAVLGVANRNGIVRPTELYHQLLAMVLKEKPKVIALDTAADIFAGNENDRAQVRQFVGLLRALALAAAIATNDPANGAAVLLASHPSLQGVSTDTGLSGSTAWHNSVRARLYLKAATNGDAEAGMRLLEMRKSNYGPLNQQLALRWKDGVFVPEGKPTPQAVAHAEATGETVFLDLLARYVRDGRNLSEKARSGSYAPGEFASEPEAKAKHLSKEDLAAAMKRLFSKQKIRLVTYGRPSNPHTRIALTELPL